MLHTRTSRLSAAASIAAIALLGLVGCSGGGDDAADQPDNAGLSSSDGAEESAAEETAAEDEGSGGAPSLDGEGIAFGAESITGVDYDITCTGTGDDLTLSGLATDGEGTTHAVTYASGTFSYVTSGADPMAEGTTLTVAAELDGTTVTAEESGDGYTFSGTGTAASIENPTSELQEFTANFTCDTTI
ncbi:MAG: lipoprotein LpqH [Pseudoclavibacter sp.]